MLSLSKLRITHLLIGVALALVFLLVPRIFTTSLVVLIAAIEIPVAFVVPGSTPLARKVDRAAILIGGLLVVLIYYVVTR
jgi:hypothetical protein